MKKLFCGVVLALALFFGAASTSQATGVVINSGRFVVTATGEVVFIPNTVVDKVTVFGVNRTTVFTTDGFNGHVGAAVGGKKVIIRNGRVVRVRR